MQKILQVNLPGQAERCISLQKKETKRLGCVTQDEEGSWFAFDLGAGRVRRQAPAAPVQALQHLVLDVDLRARTEKGTENGSSSPPTLQSTGSFCGEVALITASYNTGELCARRCPRKSSSLRALNKISTLPPSQHLRSARKQSDRCRVAGGPAPREEPAVLV